MLKVPYAFYKEAFFGQLGEMEFYRLGVFAGAYLDDLTMGRVSGELTDDQRERVSLAYCAVVDIRQTLERRSGIASESNDGVSISYASEDEGGKSEGRQLYEAAALYLANTGLLYRGVV